MSTDVKQVRKRKSCIEQTHWRCFPYAIHTHTGLSLRHGLKRYIAVTFSQGQGQGMRARILLIEDDSALRSNFALSLDAEGYQVHAAACLSQAFSLWQTERGSQGIDLVLLDLGLPDGSGDSFLSAIRPPECTPVIVISARHSEQEKVRLLNLGADAYLVKPFTVPTLLDCVLAVLKARLQQDEPPSWRYAFGEISIDLQTESVVRAGVPVILTPTEYRVLALLVKSAGRVVTDSQLLTQAMGAGYAGRRDLLRHSMAQLRAKLEASPWEPTLLLAVPGVGYQFAVASGPSLASEFAPIWIPNGTSGTIKG
jgi:two-component system KDP operon response regulator KdpE